MRQSEVQYGAPAESSYLDSSDYQAGRLPVKRKAKGNGGRSQPANFFNPIPDPLPPAPLPYVVSERYSATSQSPANFGRDMEMQPNNFATNSGEQTDGSFSPPRPSTTHVLPILPHLRQQPQAANDATPEMYSDSEEEGDGGPPEYLSGWHEPPKLLLMMSNKRQAQQGTQTSSTGFPAPLPFPRPQATTSALARHIAASTSQDTPAIPSTPNGSVGSKKGTPKKGRSLVVKFREDGGPASLSGMSSDGDERLMEGDPAMDGGDYVMDPNDPGDDERGPYERDQFEPPFIPKTTRLGTGAIIAKSPETDLFSIRVKPFVAKLTYLLRNPDLYGDVMFWNDDLKLFLLAFNSTRMAENVLPHFYGHKAVTAFQRQLNVYGFARTSTAQVMETVNAHREILTISYPQKNYVGYTHASFRPSMDDDQLAGLIPKPSRARSAGHKAKGDRAPSGSPAASTPTSASKA